VLLDIGITSAMGRSIRYR